MTLRLPRTSDVPKVPKSRRYGEVGYWSCPKCPYRIALNFPNGIDDAIAAHWLAHTFPVELEISEKAKGWSRDKAHTGIEPVPSP